MYMSLEWCGWTHHRALSQYQLVPDPDSMETIGVDDEIQCMIAQYHAPQTSMVCVCLEKCVFNGVVANVKLNNLQQKFSTYFTLMPMM